MKFRIFLIISLTACLFSETSTQAQVLRTGRNTFASLEIFGFFDIHLQKLDEYKPISKKDQMKYSATLSYMDSLLRVMAFEKVVQGLKNNGIEILPVETFSKYSESPLKSGSPSPAFFKKAVKKAFENGLATDHLIVAKFSFANKRSMDAILSQKRQFIPKVSATIFVYDKSIEQIFKKDFTVEGDLLEYDFFDKLNRDHMAELVSHMEPLIEGATAGCLKEIK